MRTAFLKITEQCTRACPFCFNRETERTGRSLSANELAAAVGAVEALGATDLILTGGEPLAYRGLGKALRSIAARGFSGAVLTNGSELDRSRAKRLAASWPGSFVWSLNDVHNRESDADRVLRDLEKRLPKIAAALAGRLSLIFVFTRPTARLVAPILALAERAGVPILVQPAWLSERNPNRLRLDPFAIRQSDWDALMTTMIGWAQRSGIWQYLDYIEGLRRKDGTRPPSCPMGREAMVVETDGTVYPCFHRRDLPAGNVLDDPPESIAARLAGMRPELSSAACFGAHCVSLFVY